MKEKQFKGIRKLNHKDYPVCGTCVFIFLTIGFGLGVLFMLALHHGLRL